MDQRVKRFIENHIAFLDEGDYKTFFSIATEFYFNSTIKLIVQALNEAGIDTREAREELVLESIRDRLEMGVHVEKFGIDSSLDAQMLCDFLGFEFYGFNVEYLIALINENAANFSYWLEYDGYTKTFTTVK